MIGRLARSSFPLFARICSTVLPLFVVACPATAQVSPGAGEDPAPSTILRRSIVTVAREEARRYVLDAGGLLTSPLRWDGGQWARAGAVIAALGVLASDDAAIDQTVQRHRSTQTDAFARGVTPLGSYGGVGLSAAVLGGGLLFKDDSLRDTGRDAVEAELLAAGVFTPLLKVTIGRLRPSQGSDADEFHAFSARNSFPSGHATEAFALASVFAARARGWVVPTIAYALASGVAFARVNDRAHFASDVVAGAVVGTVVGRSIVHRHSDKPEDYVPSVLPLVTRRGAGLVLSWSFGGAATRPGTTSPLGS
jgi:membrane-associated phospholipid phosphatase